MEKHYSIKIHALPVVYDYFRDIWKDSYSYLERYGLAEAVDGRIRIRQPETWGEGFCDCYGNVIVPCIYESVGLYYAGVSIVGVREATYINGEFVYWLHGGIDEDGNEVIPPVYEWLGDMVGGYAAAKRDGKWGMIDKTGAVAAPFIYDSMDAETDYTSNMLRVVEKDEKYGCVDREGKEVVPCVYETGDDAWEEAREYAMPDVEDAEPEIREYNRFPYETGKLGPFDLVWTEMEEPYMQPGYYTSITADKDADVVSPEEYEMMRMEYEMATERERYRIGLADEGGNIVLPLEYAHVRYAQGKGPKGFTAQKDEQWYFIELVYE